MKYSETHPNGSRIDVKASRRTVSALVADWRAKQQMPDSAPTEPDKQGAEARTDLAYTPYQDASWYGHPMRLPLGFTPNEVGTND